MRACQTCTKWDNKGRVCKVLSPPVKNCWAWTNDPNWEEEVIKSVRKYREFKQDD